MPVGEKISLTIDHLPQLNQLLRADGGAKPAAFATFPVDLDSSHEPCISPFAARCRTCWW